MTSADLASLHDYLAEQVQAIDHVLDLWVPAESVDPLSIHKAMRYSLFAGGKRIGQFWRLPLRARYRMIRGVVWRTLHPRLS